MQQINVYPPTTCLELWLNEPRRAERSQAPANLLRLMFPESIMAFDSNDNMLWQSTFENNRNQWRYENLAIGDMKSGQKIRKTLIRSEVVDDLALIKYIVKWDGTEAYLALTINNISPISWNRLVTSICLQRPASPEYIDEDNSRTFLVSDPGFVASNQLIFPEDRPMVYGIVGEELPMQDGSQRRLNEEALFVVSKDQRYVLCYAWHMARRLFLNRSQCVKCLHSDLEIHNIHSKTLIQRRGTLFLTEGSLDEAFEQYRSWKKTGGENLSLNEQ